jgi:Fe-S cluster biogenesis protein NfuA
MSMNEKISKVLSEKVNPVLASHFGGIKLTKFENGIAYVKMTGECSTCPSAQFTIEDVVKGIIMQEVPEVKDIVLDMSVDEELLDMARKILNKEKR